MGSAAGRSGTGLSPRQNALEPGVHGVPAGPAHPDRDADGAGVAESGFRRGAGRAAGVGGNWWAETKVPGRPGAGKPDARRVRRGCTRDPGQRHAAPGGGLRPGRTGWPGGCGVDPRGGVTVPDWLAVPWQRLAEVTGGAVFHDGTGGRTTGSASPSPSTPAPGPTSTGRTRSSAPGASPPPCPARSPTRWCGGSGAGTADQVIDSTPALGDLRYARAVTSVSGI